MEKYLSKEKLKNCKEYFLDNFRKIQKAAKNEYGLTFSFNLVGSAKRNLVVIKNGKVDCDYQLILQKNNQKLSPKEIKVNMIKLFNEFFKEKLKNCEDSTSSITIKMKNDFLPEYKFSYDVVILKMNGTPQILKNDKQQNKYIWNKLKDMTDFQENYKKITGSKNWNLLRDIYYTKIICNEKINVENKKKSFQILHEAVNEVLENK